MNRENKKNNVSRETFTTLLSDKLNHLNIPFIEENLIKIYRYYEILMEWNRTHNLTRITDFEDVVEKHFVDSLLLLDLNPDLTGLKFADVGTGAGFPGIPLSIFLPETEFYLIDKVQKKCSFLHYVCAELKLKNVKVINDRIENIPELFDIISIRAVSIENSFLNTLGKRLNSGGKIILYLSQTQIIPEAISNFIVRDFSDKNIPRKIILGSFS